MTFKPHSIIGVLLFIFLFNSCNKETVPVEGLNELIQAKWHFKKLKAKYFEQKQGQLVHTAIRDTNMALSFDRFNQYYDTLVDITQDTIKKIPLGNWAIEGTKLLLTDTLDRKTRYGLSILNKTNTILLSFDSLLKVPKNIVYRGQEYSYQYIEYQITGKK